MNIPNEDKHLEIWMNISQQIGEMTSAIKSVLDRLADHDKRITRLELHPSNSVNYKDGKSEYGWIVQWLLKGLLISLGIIATVTGASGLVSKIIGS